MRRSTADVDYRRVYEALEARRKELGHARGVELTHTDIAYMVGLNPTDNRLWRKLARGEGISTANLLAIALWLRGSFDLTPYVIGVP